MDDISLAIFNICSFCKNYSINKYSILVYRYQKKELLEFKSN